MSMLDEVARGMSHFQCKLLLHTARVKSKKNERKIVSLVVYLGDLKVKIFDDYYYLRSSQKLNFIASPANCIFIYLFSSSICRFLANDQNIINSNNFFFSLFSLSRYY